ncbi:hypothetical protein HORIV_13430 [Vreelandella olivaria]|uniref:FMN-binding glutamate synthase family protein n=1 Tax=Vreelandella olivaria TaxID=390919 RepID=A0ABM7GEF6_9GAMM|nr:hypothetical protein HORIV_13430 [Halomonas olivaria]
MIEARGLTRIPLRNAVFVACLILLLISLVGVVFSLAWLWGVVIFGMLAGLGLHDLRQTRRTVSRNYPVLAHFRYVLESIGPEIRQYFIQSDLDERPFSREQRAVVYQRSKNESDKSPLAPCWICISQGMNGSTTRSSPALLKTKTSVFAWAAVIAVNLTWQAY